MEATKTTVGVNFTLWKSFSKQISHCLSQFYKYERHSNIGSWVGHNHSVADSKQKIGLLCHCISSGSSAIFEWDFTGDGK